MSITVHYWVFAASVLSITVPIIIILTSRSPSLPVIKWFLVTLFFSFAADFVSAILVVVHATWRVKMILSSNIIVTTYSLVAPILYSIFFYFLIRWPRIKIPLLIVNVLYFSFAIANFLFIQKFSINSYSSIIEHLLVTILSLVFFYKLLRELSTTNLYKFGPFFIVSSLLVANLSKLILWSFIEYLVKSLHDNLILLLVIHNSLSTLSNIVIAYGVWLWCREESSVQTM